jgi:hypothetical protein
MRSIRGELAAAGLAVGGAELAQCDMATRMAAFGLVETDLGAVLPEELLEVVETFDDLAHFGNVRLAHQGRPEAWTA